MKNDAYKNYFDFIASLIEASPVFNEKQQIEILMSANITFFEEIILTAKSKGVMIDSLKELLNSNKHQEDKQKAVNEFIQNLPEQYKPEIILKAIDNSVIRLIEALEKNHKLDDEFWNKFKQLWEKSIKDRISLEKLQQEGNAEDKLKSLIN